MIFKQIPLPGSDAVLDIYIADPLPGFTRRALLVIPGGGYCNVCAAREGEPIAHAFMPHGYNAFVLHYSVNGKSFPTQLREAALAVMHIRENAENYGIDPCAVFAVGFSAGGHLAASLATMWHREDLFRGTAIEPEKCRPTGVFLCYPVISGTDHPHLNSFRNLLQKDAPSEDELHAVSPETLVDEKTVPAYIMHTFRDNAVPVQNALSLARAYADAGIPFEMHIYPEGPHGVSLANDIVSAGNPAYLNPHTATWILDAVSFAEGLLHKAE